MIKIDVSKIKNWELIKEKHSEWYYKEIFPKIKNVPDELEKIYRKIYFNFKLRSMFEYIINPYIELLKKIISEEKKFSITKDLFFDYKVDEINFLSKIMKKEKNKKGILEEMFSSFKINEEYLPYNLFSYDKFPNHTGKWNRHKLLYLMGIEVCPYCQRNYINHFEENNDKRTTADLDHFYPKSLYPFLALSLYNFIPSCQICNSRFKGSKDTYNSVYPYEESFDDLGAKFNTSKEIIYEILGEKDFEFFVNIDYGNLKNEDIEKIKNSISNLGLDKVYKKSHNHYIKELLDNIEKYPKNYLESCVEIFDGYDKDENKKEKIIKYFIDIVKEPYRKRIGNGEPLAKLTKDILDEFKIKI
ncbi:hypothetical protein [Fusobacterium hwasookii]|uniref:HNH nuclease domain-containing protein n=1 Tax=Fusobacterium hwasookii ChDC F128 TaxID=1216362 RepID=A0ABN0H2G4_9FUSO|nr:hypothetical protein [Fusobacterium hwasookii]EJU08479.1 hypothetical protein B437_00075 [Fusobacterium hwasookii ChDC F128]QNE67231.1 hypothetical protein H5V36_05030 [Fusobacterium hwasookii]